jgi:hypothetical protein
MVMNAKVGRQAYIITEIIQFWVGTFLEHGTLNHPSFLQIVYYLIIIIIIFSGCPFSQIQDVSIL